MCYKWIEIVFRHVQDTQSEKNDLVIKMALNVTLFSRPVSAPQSDRKKKLWSASYGS